MPTREMADGLVISGALLRALRRLDPGLVPISTGGRLPRFGQLGRRGIDVVVAVALLVLTLPLLLSAALVIWLESVGPVFCSKPHVGQGGRTFLIWSLRTSRLASEGAALPESTRVGRFIWLTRVDQLPVLFSLVRGDMTLIGPCPDPLTVRRHDTDQGDERCRSSAVRPGLSGWLLSM